MQRGILIIMFLVSLFLSVFSLGKQQENRGTKVRSPEEMPIQLPKSYWKKLMFRATGDRKASPPAIKSPVRAIDSIPSSGLQSLDKKLPGEVESLEVNATEATEAVEISQKSESSPDPKKESPSLFKTLLDAFVPKFGADDRNSESGAASGNAGSGTASSGNNPSKENGFGFNGENNELNSGLYGGGSGGGSGGGAQGKDGPVDLGPRDPGSNASNEKGEEEFDDTQYDNQAESRDPSFTQGNPPENPSAPRPLPYYEPICFVFDIANQKDYASIMKYVVDKYAKCDVKVIPYGVLAENISYRDPDAIIQASQTICNAEAAYPGVENWSVQTHVNSKYTSDIMCGAPRDIGPEWHENNPDVAGCAELFIPPGMGTQEDREEFERGVAGSSSFASITNEGQNRPSILDINEMGRTAVHEIGHNHGSANLTEGNGLKPWGFGLETALPVEKRSVPGGEADTFSDEACHWIRIAANPANDKKYMYDPLANYRNFLDDSKIFNLGAPEPYFATDPPEGQMVTRRVPPHPNDPLGDARVKNLLQGTGVSGEHKKGGQTIGPLNADNNVTPIGGGGATAGGENSSGNQIAGSDPTVSSARDRLAGNGPNGDPESTSNLELDEKLETGESESSQALSNSDEFFNGVGKDASSEELAQKDNVGTGNSTELGNVLNQIDEQQKLRAINRDGQAPDSFNMEGIDASEQNAQNGEGNSANQDGVGTAALDDDFMEKINNNPLGEDPDQAPPSTPTDPFASVLGGQQNELEDIMDADFFQKMRDPAIPEEKPYRKIRVFKAN